MSTNKTDVAFPFRIGQTLNLQIDLGAAGKVKADIDLIKKAVNGAALASIASGSYSLAENGENHYNLALSGPAVSAANAGANVVIVSGAGLDRNVIRFYLDTTAKDLYDDLASGAVQVDLQNNAVDSSSVAANAFGSGAFASSFVDLARSAVFNATIAGFTNAGSFGKWVNDLLTSIWTAGSRTLTSLGTSSVDDIWEYNRGNITDTSGIGYWLKTQLDGAISAVQTAVNQVKAKTDLMNFVTSAIKSYPTTNISLSTSDKDDIVDRIYDEDPDDHNTASTYGRTLKYLRGHIEGKRKMINNGDNEEIYDADGSTLLGTHDITRDANDNITERGERS